MANNLEQVLLQELGYSDSPGFVSPVQWGSKRPIPGITGVYFVQNVAVAYFSRLSEADPNRLYELYQHVWNQSRVPLLYVVLPQEIRIYNVYADPVNTPTELDQEHRLLQHLSKLVTVEEARQSIQNRLLQSYDRLHLDTGAFWSTPDGQRIRRESRADHHLLRAMDQVRRHLLQEGLSNEIAYALLGRSIFICYLEDREILTKEAVFHLTDRQAKEYRTALNDLDVTYRLFERLSKRFNGDLFPVEAEERRVVRQKHLSLLREFLRGTDLDSGQQSFWPYDFRYIPIELVSWIYDIFLNSDERRNTGTYYTPLSLVDYLLQETLPIEEIDPDTTVLDPACGSGVFLVRAYQRLVEAWRQKHGKRPTSQQLGRILKRNIFGVDKQPEAIRVAAFSLYLAMLDHLGPEDREISEQSFRFPQLKDENLIVADFFSPEVQRGFAGQRFDRVIGNPPWGKSTLTAQAAQWLHGKCQWE